MEMRTTAERVIELTAGPPLYACLAAGADEVAEAQHLRFEVFAEELGARLPETHLALDCDRFDAHCDHLLVREGISGDVVGTYRILTPEGARAAGGLYCDGEFDLARLAPLRDRMVEVGRACVRADYRGAAVISLLWRALLGYVMRRGFDYVVGCASLSTDDGGHAAATLCRRLLAEHLAAPEWRVAPRRAFALEGWREVDDAAMPGLIKGYLKLGAQVCGAPAWDPEFQSADVLLLLPMQSINRRYVERLLRAA
jgi:putative hemolysin